MKEIKLHIGCGEKILPGYIHIDKKSYPHVDYVTDCSDLHMFDDNSVDLIYACHLLEHIERYNIDKVLREWFRVLKPGGVLRLSVPDFESLIEVYDKYKDLELILGPLYGRGNEYNKHYVTFDFRYLKKRLQIVGFDEVRRFSWQNTELKDYDDYSQSYIPHMDKEKGILISLNVEAVK
jgi:predicted SAM-dependent methyltransferase